MVLTKRDLELFKMISSYSMLSTRQINQLCFNSIQLSTVLRRLRVLEQNKFIHRLIGLESKELLWILQTKGAEAASVSIPKRHYSKNLLEHDFKLLSLRLTLESSKLAHSWLPEHEIRSNIFRKNDFRLAKEKLIPDGIMGIEINGKKQSLALELELTLKNKDKLKKTLGRYKEQDGILGVWYLVPTTSLLNSIHHTWNNLLSYKNGPTLYLSFLNEVMKDSLQARVFEKGKSYLTGNIWTPRDAHPDAQQVSKLNQKLNHQIKGVTNENDKNFLDVTS